MEHEKARKYTKGKTKIITYKINPELLKKLDKAIKKDAEVSNRSDVIETCLLKYLESRGEL